MSCSAFHRALAHTPPCMMHADRAGSLRTGKGVQGRIGTSAKTILTHHIMKTKGKLEHVDEKVRGRGY